jgi:IS5 family transposase
VIEARRLQRTFGEGLIEEEVADLWEDWMRHADAVLSDEKLIETVYLALAKRSPRSQNFGRPGTPAEVVLRLLVLKHARDWSYDTLEREVRANLVYREFTRVGAGKVPDAKTLGQLGRTLGPEVVEKIHQRVVALAQEEKIVQGKRLRVDTTVVETNIHHPTDSSLLGDGVRVLTRTMKKITELAGEAGTRLRNRMRSVQHRLIEIGRASRSKGEAGREKLKKSYEELLSATGQVVRQAQRFSAEIASGVKHSADVFEQAALEGHKKFIDTMVPRVQQVIRQTKARVLEGTNHFAEKLLSIFEPTTEIIRKGKAGKPTEFGKMVKIQEAENQIVTSYEVYSQRPSDSDLLIPAIETHQEQLGRAPRLVAADAGFYSAKNEAGAQARGVERVAIPNRSTKSAERKRHQKKRWFRKAQKWRTGCEGRISLLKRRHGLDRCLYKGDGGMKRWVGLGVIADNLINIGRKLAAQNSG